MSFFYRLGNATLLYPLLWRFLPVIDVNVDFYLSRDLDSRISDREVGKINKKGLVHFWNICKKNNTYLCIKQFLQSRAEYGIAERRCSITHLWDLLSNLFSPNLQFIFSKFCLFYFFASSKVGRIVKSVSSAIYRLFRTCLKKIKQKKINKIWRK